MGDYTMAFYQGMGDGKDRIARAFGRVQAWIVRGATRSAFSHCELIRHPDAPPPGLPVESISSSGRDGGVRIKWIRYDAGKWAFKPVPWAPADAWDRAARHLGKPYDYAGLLKSHVIPLNREDPEAWFCSELCAEALGLRMPNALSPGALHRALEDDCDIWRRTLRVSHGRREGGARRGWL
ncbi:hypothetical protein [Jannaschia sp. W003]|uniref:hypothetical protein n=1 Tax=Jannaschia sp. W003 TaxID=2867012 RepID=UPI0021A403D3|nr:hypothetical protein [Jannaschia sp. W003]UWQ22811.1 hypothetical protein K3554_07250 [Jannaschia sp. W003]